MLEDDVLQRHERTIKEKIQNNQMTIPEYYKEYINWETTRWTKNVITHVGPQGQDC